MAGGRRLLATTECSTAGALELMTLSKPLPNKASSLRPMVYAAMNLLAELARLNADPTLVARVQGMVRQLQEQVQALEHKNQKLVLELAHLKLLRFGTKSEALTAEQPALFEGRSRPRPGRRAGGAGGHRPHHRRGCA